MQVEKITQLVQTVNLVYGISYKVVITIDDLDRVPLPKVIHYFKLYCGECLLFDYCSVLWRSRLWNKMRNSTNAKHQKMLIFGLIKGHVIAQKGKMNAIFNSYQKNTAILQNLLNPTAILHFFNPMWAAIGFLHGEKGVNCPVSLVYFAPETGGHSNIKLIV